MPVDRAILDARLDYAAWPDPDESLVPSAAPVREAWEVAGGRLANFDDAVSRITADRSLSIEGRRLKLQEFADRHTPSIRQKIEQVERAAAAALQERKGQIAGIYAKPPADAGDAALLREVRDFLRSLPETQRMALVHRETRAGDRAAVRAVMTGPAYLTGVDRDQLTTLCEHLFDQDFPDRAGAFAALEQAVDLAQRSLSGVIEHMGDVIARHVEAPQAMPRGFVPPHRGTPVAAR